MAEYTMTTNIPDINLLKSTKILVYVEEALQDVLVVSYVFDSKFFQGILLDSSKRRIPPGITLPNLASKVSLKNNDDELHKAINQRFTYFQDMTLNCQKWKVKRTKNGKIKNQRMNVVRLRPRQVLCSKCRSICTENSESVDHSKASGDQPGSKLAMAVENSRRSLRLSTTIEKSPRPLLYDSLKNHQMKLSTCGDKPAILKPSLVPKLSRLQPNDITSALNGKYSPNLPLLNGSYCVASVIASPKSENSDNKFCLEDVDQEFAVSLPKTGSIPQKSAVDMEVSQSQMEKLEEESKMVLRKKHSIGSMEDLWDESIFEDQLQKTRTTPVLKISFGAEGQGTVLKIPAKVTNNSSESEEVDDSHVETRSMLKAARKAHKKAKKEAKKRMCAVNSPARSPAYENFFSHRSRHKIKRKRKHKYPRLSTNDSESEISKNEKLSMSFKRLGGNAYTATRNEIPDASPNSQSSEDSVVPIVLPESNLKLENIADTEFIYKAKNGKIIEVGDVVWAKVRGFSWWPGKVVTFKLCANEQDKIYAYISWFGSSTASVISCDNVCLFLDNYKLRFNKRKRSGQYTDAVKIATVEAKKKRGLQMRSSTTAAQTSTNGGGGVRCF